MLGIWSVDNGFDYTFSVVALSITGSFECSNGVIEVESTGGWIELPSELLMKEPYR